MSFTVESDMKPTVAFFKDGQQIKSNNAVKVLEEGNVHILEYPCAQFRHSGKCFKTILREKANVNIFRNVSNHCN